MAGFRQATWRRRRAALPTPVATECTPICLPTGREGKSKCHFKEILTEIDIIMLFSSNSWRLPPDETLQVADPKAKKAEVGDEEVSTPKPGKITTAPHLSIF